MDLPEREGVGVMTGMESQDVHIPQLFSSMSNSSSIKTRSGSDGTCDSAERTNSSSRGDSSDNTSLEDEEDDNNASNFNANEAKIAGDDFDDADNCHRDDSGCRFIDSDYEDGEKAGAGAGAGANARISQMRQKTASGMNHATVISVVKQASHLIRSVEIDATCLWDGDGRNEPMTDVRIVMVIDSRPNTHLSLLDLNQKLVKAGSFYSIQKLSPTMSETVPIGEEVLFTPRQGSRSTDASGGTGPNPRFGQEDDLKGGNPQRRQPNEENSVQVNHDGDDERPKFKKRRLFPITRSTAPEYLVSEKDYEVNHASSESSILDNRGWPAVPVGPENSLWKSREWMEKSTSLRKESRSTSGHTVHIHSRRTSSSRSSAPPESFPLRTAGPLTSTSGLADQTVLHRHCEACKLGGQRLPSGSSPGLRTAVEEGSSMKLGSGDKSHQIAHQICCQPHEQNGSVGKGLKIQEEKQNESVTKIQEPVRDDRDGHINTYRGLASRKFRSNGSRKTEEILRNRAFLGLNEKCVPMAAPRNEVPRRSGHEYHMNLSSSSDAQNSFLGPTETERAKSIGQSLGRISPVGCALQDKSNNQANMQARYSPKIDVQNSIRTSNGSLSTDISPKIKLRRERASSADPAVDHVSPGSNPIPINKDGKLDLYFANNVASGIYLIEIEASITLPIPNSSGWRCFRIPGLLPSQEIDTPVLINFRVQSIPPLSPTQSEKSPSIENPDCSWIAEAQFNSDDLFDVGLSTATQMSGKFWLRSLLILQLRLKIPVYVLDSWDSSISLQTFPRWSEGHGLQIEHRVSLNMIGLAHDIFAERVKYSFLIKNGFCNTAEYTMNPGECLIELGNIDWQDTLMQQHGELTVIRHLEDLCKPLEISFTFGYPKKDQLTIRLPMLSPMKGNVVSERIVLVKPLSPLIFEYPGSDSISTWRRMDQSDEQSQADCFDRQHLPRLFPEGLKDDLVIRVNELAPVCYRALQREGNPLISEDPSNLVWNLKINIDKVFGGGLECLMKFDIQVGRNDQVLTVSPHDWTPDLFAIQGQLATQAGGEWRKDRNGNLTLFRLPEIGIGQTIEIELRWYKMIVRERLRSDDVEQSAVQHSLPKIIGKSILGGSLRCNIDSAIHISSNGKLRDAPWQFSKNSFEKQIRLPKLYPGYTIGLSLTGVPNEPARSIRFEDEQPKKACTDPIKLENHVSRLNNQAATDQLTPVHSLHPDLHSSSTLDRRTREKALSWAGYSCKLILRLLRCAFTPFLFICAFQFALSRIMHARRPVDFMGFSSVKGRHDSLSGLRSILSLESLTVPWSQPESEDQSGLSMGASRTKEPFSSSTSEHSLGLEKFDGAENETTIESSEDPEHEEPTAEGMGVMDWIDRALGWEDITH